MKNRDKLLYAGAVVAIGLGSVLLVLAPDNVEKILAGIDKDTAPFSSIAPTLRERNSDPESLQVLDERPAFIPDRHAIRAAPERDVEEEAVDPENMPFALQGIIIAGGQKSIMVKKGEDNEAMLVHPDEDVGGWKLKEVRQDAVVFEAGGVRRIVHLPDGKDKQADGNGEAEQSSDE